MSRSYTVAIEGQNYPLQVQKRKHCRRIILRFNLKQKQFQISIPEIVSYDDAIDFFEKNYEWAKKQVESVVVDIFSNNVISFKGQDYIIQWIHSYHKAVIVDYNLRVIKVYYDIERNKEDNLMSFVKEESKSYFYELSLEKAKELGVSFSDVLITDNISKWGSCSSKGVLRYNFRLIMAPLFVIDYIVAHEVAHLREFNHSKNFWDTVAFLTPYLQEGRDWLKHKGRVLY